MMNGLQNAVYLIRALNYVNSSSTFGFKTMKMVRHESTKISFCHLPQLDPSLKYDKEKSHLISLLNFYTWPLKKSRYFIGSSSTCPKSGCQFIIFTVAHRIWCYSTFVISEESHWTQWHTKYCIDGFECENICWIASLE